jgi:hypothetical protein
MGAMINKLIVKEVKNGIGHLWSQSYQIKPYLKNLYLVQICSMKYFSHLDSIVLNWNCLSVSIYTSVKEPDYLYYVSSFSVLKNVFFL